MHSTSIKLPETTDEILDEYAVENHDGNRSQATRDLLSKGLEYDERVSRLETERDRLQRQLPATNVRQEDVGEIVEYVEGERRLQERREDRQSANVFRRAWWWVAGAPD